MPASTQETFESWLDGARRGERAAWESLYREFAPAVLGFLRAQRVDQPDDVLADVWLSVVRNLARFSGTPGGFRSWLLAIANHRVVDLHRADQRRVEEVALAQVPEIDGIEDPSLPVDGVRELDDLLDGLAPGQRSVLYLRYVLDMPQHEIATVLDMTLPAVKMQQRRGLDAISARLDGEGRHDG